MPANMMVAAPLVNPQEASTRELLELAGRTCVSLSDQMEKSNQQMERANTALTQQLSAAVAQFAATFAQIGTGVARNTSDISALAEDAIEQI